MKARATSVLQRVAAFAKAIGQHGRTQRDLRALLALGRAAVRMCPKGFVPCGPFEEERAPIEDLRLQVACLQQKNEEYARLWDQRSKETTEHMATADALVRERDALLERADELISEATTVFMKDEWHAKAKSWYDALRVAGAGGREDTQEAVMMRDCVCGHPNIAHEHGGGRCEAGGTATRERIIPCECKRFEEKKQTPATSASSSPPPTAGLLARWRSALVTGRAESFGHDAKRIDEALRTLDDFERRAREAFAPPKGQHVGNWSYRAMEALLCELLGAS